MKVLVLGAGVVGVASAWYLRQAGHEVTVIDRQPAAGMETSFANGGQISVSHAEPWANPAAPLTALRWLGREDAPLFFRARFDTDLLAWCWRFLRECTAERTRANIRAIVSLGLYSRASLKELRAATGIAYDHLERGILHIYTDPRVFAAAIPAAAAMREFGCDRRVVDVDECIRIEPALAAARPQLVGGTYTASDESGDAHLFTQSLARLAEESGVRFRYQTTIERLHLQGGRVVGAEVDGGQAIAADATVVALGSYSRALLQPLGISLAVYPAKGYSATIALSPDSDAPTTSLTDDGFKIVFSRLGQRLRIAGTAEFNGFNLDLNAVRCQALVNRARQLFPNLRPASEPDFWCGLRPATPSNVPIIGRARIPGLFLNTGHGTLGWTLSCGSGRALADLLSGRQADIDFPFAC